MVKINHSKSSISSYYFCPYVFYKQKVLGESGSMPLVAKQGIEIHRYFEMFFGSIESDGIDFEKLWKMDENRHFGSEKNEVYSYFMSKLFSYLDPQYKDDQKFYVNLRAFAIWNATRWRDVRYHFRSKEKCRRYFMPRAVEEKYQVHHPCTPRLIKGYVDVRFACPKIEGRERVRLSDYKTGKVPIGVRREGDGETPYYSKELKGKYVFEGSFYCIEYLIKHDYEIKGEEGKEYVYKNGKKVKLSWLEYEYLFTNSSKVYSARKKCNIVALRTCLKKMRVIDKHIADYELGIRSFDREPSEYKCQWCNYFLEDCQHNIDPIQAETITSLMIPEDIDINEDFYNIV